MGSRLVQNAETWRTHRRQAEAILDDCATALHELRPVARERARLSRETGTAPATCDIRPIDTLRADTLLVELAVALVTSAVDGAPNADQLTAMAFMSLNQTLGARIEAAWLTYDKVMCEKFRQTHSECRRRMAREIHDHLGSGISLAQRQLELYDVLRGRDAAAAHRKVAEARNVLNGIMEDTRRLASGLRIEPPPCGLGEAVHAFVESGRLERTAVDVHVVGNDSWIPDEMCGELFAVIREALRNAFAHAQASRVTTRIEVDPTQVRTLVEDDGKGFAPQAVRDGCGLSSMTERVRLLGGDIEISSEPGGGTRVEITVDLLEAGYEQAG